MQTFPFLPLLLLVSLFNYVACLPSGSSHRTGRYMESPSDNQGDYYSQSSRRNKQRGSVHQGGRPRREAILITDGKFDDVMASHYLSHTGIYDQIHGVVNGIQNKEAAHGAIRDFHKQMYDAHVKAGIPVNPPKMKFYAGGDNPMQEEMPHEANYPGTPLPIKHSIKHLAGRFKPDTEYVDVFHLAPIYDRDMDKITKSVYRGNKKIGFLHSTVGYNNNQGPEHQSNGDAEKKHLQGIHRKLQNAEAFPILIQSKTTFGGPSGGTQPVSWLKGRTPREYLLAATEKERFHVDQMLEADRMIAEHNARHMHDHSMQVPVPRPIPGETYAQQQQNTYLARAKDDEYGRKLAGILIDGATQRQESIAHTDGDESAKQNIIRRLDAAKKGWINECEAETCDANHVAVTLDAYFNHPEKFVPATAISGREIRKAEDGDEIHGQTLLGETNDHSRELLEPAFPKVFPQ